MSKNPKWAVFNGCRVNGTHYPTFKNHFFDTYHKRWAVYEYVPDIDRLSSRLELMLLWPEVF